MLWFVLPHVCCKCLFFMNVLCACLYSWGLMHRQPAELSPNIMGTPWDNNVYWFVRKCQRDQRLKCLISLCASARLSMEINFSLDPNTAMGHTLGCTLNLLLWFLNFLLSFSLVRSETLRYSRLMNIFIQVYELSDFGWSSLKVCTL